MNYFFPCQALGGKVLICITLKIFNENGGVRGGVRERLARGGGRRTEIAESNN